MTRPRYGSGGARRSDRAESVSRRVALAVLNDVAAGSHAEESLSRHLNFLDSIGGDDRALATELVYGASSLADSTRLDHR